MGRPGASAWACLAPKTETISYIQYKNPKAETLEKRRIGRETETQMRNANMAHENACATASRGPAAGVRVSDRQSIKDLSK